MTDFFSKHYGEGGYTLQEALQKKAKVDEAHCAGEARSKWRESEIVPDGRGGYQVKISTIK